MIVPAAGLLGVLAAVASEEPGGDRRDAIAIFRRALTLNRPDLVVACFTDSWEQDLPATDVAQTKASRFINDLVISWVVPSSSLDELAARLRWVERLVEAWNDRWFEIRGHRTNFLSTINLVRPPHSIDGFFRKVEDLGFFQASTSLDAIIDARWRTAQVLPSFGGRPVVNILGISALAREDDYFNWCSRRGDDAVIRWSSFTEKLAHETGVEFAVNFGSGDDVIPIYSWDETRVLLRGSGSGVKSTIRRAAEWGIFPRGTAAGWFEDTDPDE